MVEREYKKRLLQILKMSSNGKVKMDITTPKEKQLKLKKALSIGKQSNAIILEYLQSHRQKGETKNKMAFKKDTKAIQQMIRDIKNQKD